MRRSTVGTDSWHHRFRCAPGRGADGVVQCAEVSGSDLYRHGATPPAADAFEPAPKINRPPEFFGGGGGLRSTADDMVRFLHALVTPPARQHLQRAIPLAAEPRFSLSGGRSPGRGWDPIVTERGVTILLKDGAGTAGCTSLLGYSPDTVRGLRHGTDP